jgi:hypothetical protein
MPNLNESPKFEAPKDKGSEESEQEKDKEKKSHKFTREFEDGSEVVIYRGPQVGKIGSSGVNAPAFDDRSIAEKMHTSGGVGAIKEEDFKTDQDLIILFHDVTKPDKVNEQDVLNKIKKSKEALVTFRGIDLLKALDTFKKSNIKTNQEAEELKKEIRQKDDDLTKEEKQLVAIIDAFAHSTQIGNPQINRNGVSALEFNLTGHGELLGLPKDMVLKDIERRLAHGMSLDINIQSDSGEEEIYTQKIVKNPNKEISSEKFKKLFREKIQDWVKRYGFYYQEAWSFYADSINNYDEFVAEHLENHKKMVEYIDSKMND